MPLTLRHIEALLTHRQALPQDVRKTAWRFLLALPNDTEYYARLSEKGLHTGVHGLAYAFPLSDRRLLRRLEGVCSALFYWSPNLSEISWLPRFAFPFVKFWGPDVTAAFETCVILLKTYESWLLFRDVPPNRELILVDSLLAAQNRSRPASVERPADWAWTLFITLFTDQLSGEEWLTFCDHWFCSGSRSFLYCAMVAFALTVPDHYFLSALRAPYPGLSITNLLATTKDVAARARCLKGRIRDENPDLADFLGARFAFPPISGIRDVPPICLPPMTIHDYRDDLERIEEEQREYTRIMRRAYFHQSEDPMDTRFSGGSSKETGLSSGAHQATDDLVDRAERAVRLSKSVSLSAQRHVGLEKPAVTALQSAKPGPRAVRQSSSITSVDVAVPSSPAMTTSLGVQVSQDPPAQCVSRSIARSMAAEVAMSALEIQKLTAQTAEDQDERATLHPAIAKSRSVTYRPIPEARGFQVNLSEAKRSSSNGEPCGAAQRIGSAARDAILGRLVQVRPAKSPIRSVPHSPSRSQPRSTVFDIPMPPDPGVCDICQSRGVYESSQATIPKSGTKPRVRPSSAPNTTAPLKSVQRAPPETHGKHIQPSQTTPILKNAMTQYSSVVASEQSSTHSIDRPDAQLPGDLEDVTQTIPNDVLLELIDRLQNDMTKGTLSRREGTQADDSTGELYAERLASNRESRPMTSHLPQIGDAFLDSSLMSDGVPEKNVAISDVPVDVRAGSDITRFISVPRRGLVQRTPRDAVSSNIVSYDTTNTSRESGRITIPITAPHNDLHVTIPSSVGMASGSVIPLTNSEGESSSLPGSSVMATPLTKKHAISGGVLSGEKSIKSRVPDNSRYTIGDASISSAGGILPGEGRIPTTLPLVDSEGELTISSVLDPPTNGLDRSSGLEGQQPHFSASAYLPKPSVSLPFLSSTTGPKSSVFLPEPTASASPGREVPSIGLSAQPTSDISETKPGVPYDISNTYTYSTYRPGQTGSLLGTGTDPQKPLRVTIRHGDKSYQLGNESLETSLSDSALSRNLQAMRAQVNALTAPLLQQSRLTDDDNSFEDPIVETRSPYGLATPAHAEHNGALSGTELQWPSGTETVSDLRSWRGSDVRAHLTQACNNMRSIVEDVNRGLERIEDDLDE